MKFSILTMLLVTAFLGLAVAATLDQGRLFQGMYAAACIVSICWFLATSVNPASRRAGVFCRTALLCSAAYLLLPYLSDGEMYQSLPHVVVYEFLDKTNPAAPGPSEIVGPTPIGGRSIYEAPAIYDTAPTYPPQSTPRWTPNLWPIHITTSCLFGLLGGCFSLWNYIRQERKAQKS